MFDLDKYNQLLNTQWLGQSISYFEELESTNTYLKKLEADRVTHGQLCLADCQSRGRGQYERNWISEGGKNLTFSLAFKPSTTERFHILALACARAAVTEIEDQIGCEAFIKWPNDIIIDGKKVAGVLTESMFNGNALDRLLIGIGMNVNQTEFPKELRHKATSLRQINGASLQREPLLSNILSRIEYEYIRWHKHNDDLLRFINKKIIGYGRWVHMQVNGHEYDNMFKLLGVNQEGQLTAISKEGDLETFSYEQIRVHAD